ncbi:MAG TPA: hypothetical protein VJT54_08450 [Verrucomicrobiae bacterium]|nr:hypothetical protein [Verrucomicrobiae bacterium]
MNARTQPILITMALFALLTLIDQPSTLDAQGTAFTYQGRLNTTNGPANGSYDLTFTAYGVSSGGSAVAGPVTNSTIVVSNGLFTTTIDFGAGVFNGATYWLELGVRTNGSGTFATLAPRQQVAPTPYAIFSENSGAAVSVAASGVSAGSLNTLGAPASGQVLAFNGSNLVWSNLAPAGGGWSLTGNAGTTPGVNYLGTSDSQPLEFKVGGTRALRLEPAGSGAPNVVGGAPVNYMAPGTVGATIAGGGAVNYFGAAYSNVVSGVFGTVGGGVQNTVSGAEATVAGGYLNNDSGYIAVIGGGYNNIANNNEAAVGGGDFNAASGIEATVGGGGGNSATGDNSVVGGGGGNTASGEAASIPGGYGNIASGQGAFAAGSFAQATNDGSFVWSDDTGSGINTFASTANNQFLIRAVGGVGIGTSQTPPGGLRVHSGGLAVTGASSPNYTGAAGVFLEKFGTTAGAIYAYNYTAGTPLSLALNSPGGNVGIGTLTPQNTLDVNGITRTHSIIITGGSDLAEPFKMGGQKIPQGAVVVIDEERPGQVKMSNTAYDTHVAGVVSGANGINPGIALHQAGTLEGDQNVALTGRVYVLADASRGAIRPGDLLTTSDTPGHAMKATDHARAPGAILGKAMTGLSAGKGMVLVLVTLQ